ncbi:Sec1 domain-containing protein 2 [Coemansia guatemalensis]|uniref:Sec1 domain-containing protein 2 n=1 Tax=Coemansia guatemalensis TaxID=2761395 RepID=A0A9W8I3X9_9FUNG|nr:Sec1 domain-containing protein 2 [Coemansia guatemalensis]
MSCFEYTGAPTNTSSLAECTAHALAALLAAHSQGLETTIYADSVALHTINFSIRGGLLGLLHFQNDNSAFPSSSPRARNIKSLEAQLPPNRSSTGQRDPADGAGLKDGHHVLFLVGAASWPKVAWTAIAHVLSSCSYLSCTLCLASPEEMWSSISAAFPPKEGTIKQPLTRASATKALDDLLRLGQQNNDDRSALGMLNANMASVCTAPLLAATSLAENMFVMPDTSHIFPKLTKYSSGGKPENDGLGPFLSKSQLSGWRGESAKGADSRQQIEQLSLNIMSLVRGLGLRGKFYSLGDTARRAARRCAGISRSIDSVSAQNEMLQDAVVVLVDRTVDLVAPTHHSSNLLDQMYHALPRNDSNCGSGCDRIVRTEEDQGHNYELGQCDLIPGRSLLSLLCSQTADELQNSDGLRATLDLWETTLMHDRTVALQVLRNSLAGELAAVSGNSADISALSHGRPTAENMQALINIVKTQLKASGLSSRLVDMAQAVVDTEDVGMKELWKEAEGVEKTLKLIIGGIKDSLPDHGASVRDIGHSPEADDAEEGEMSAAWDQVLTAIPTLTSTIVELAEQQAESIASVHEIETWVSQWLWRHTPAPGMIIMASSLLAPTKVGIPHSQRALAEQRLATDYTAIYSAAAKKHDISSATEQAAQDAAYRWAEQVVKSAHLIAVSEGQRSELKYWRELASMSTGSNGAYTGILAQVVSSVLNGNSRLCSDLEHAEQSAAAATANLIKGFGRRFLSSGGSGAAAGNGQNAADAAAESSTVVFIVIGGVTFEEAAGVVAATRELAGERTVLLGGTTICAIDACSALV